MRFIEHGVYLLRLLNPGRPGEQSQYFEVLEVLEYRGQYIIYGEVRADQIRPARGLVQVAGRPTAFPVFPAITRSEFNNLLAITGGDIIGISPAPSQLLVGALKMPVGEEVLVMNCNRTLAALWGGQPRLSEPKRPNRDGLLKKCTRQIDLYHDWKQVGHWPEWFLADRRKARAPVNRN